MPKLAAVLALLASCASPALDEAKLVDLTWAFDRDSVYWPTAQSFELTTVAHGANDQGLWYASNDFRASEHGGTHLDAPIHFAEGRWSSHEIPLRHFIGPARVIDVRAACAADRDHRLSVSDVEAYEARHGALRAGDVVLVHTGWGRFWPNRERYLGSAERGVADNLHFPGIGKDAAELLVERGVELVGIDTASLDHGPTTTFDAHRVLAGANVPGLENVAHLELLPPRGATLIALPMKIRDGTGGPCRIVALLP